MHLSKETPSRHIPFATIRTLPQRQNVDLSTLLNPEHASREKVIQSYRLTLSKATLTANINQEF